MLDDYTASSMIDVNVPGCLALADPANGPACAAALEPWIQCYAEACSSAECAATSATFNACITTVDASGAACYAKLAAAHQGTVCQADLGSGGFIDTKCNTSTQVLNAICGTGP
jgi:uncharacterized membrane protein YqiK